MVIKTSSSFFKVIANRLFGLCLLKISVPSLHQRMTPGDALLIRPGHFPHERDREHGWSIKDRVSYSRLHGNGSVPAR